MRSKVNRAYQEEQRNKIQDSEYVRYRSDCNGKPFTTDRANKNFNMMIAVLYASWDSTVEQILDDYLTGFALDVITTLAIPDSTEDRGRFNSYARNQEMSVYGFSFCNHVAKRLVLLRKAGKLVRKKLLNRKTSVRKPKRVVNNVAGGSLVRKVE